MLYDVKILDYDKMRLKTMWWNPKKYQHERHGYISLRLFLIMILLLVALWLDALIVGVIHDPKLHF
jgi:hypothetical protein